MFMLTLTNKAWALFVALGISAGLCGGCATTHLKHEIALNAVSRILTHDIAPIAAYLHPDDGKSLEAVDYSIKHEMYIVFFAESRTKVVVYDLGNYNDKQPLSVLNHGYADFDYLAGWQFFHKNTTDTGPLFEFNGGVWTLNRFLEVTAKSAGRPALTNIVWTFK